MGKICCVHNCGMRSENNKEIKFFRFPLKETRRKALMKLSEDRQRAWLKAINRKDIKPESYKNRRVCEKHFVSGSSSKLKDSLNIDWVPTQNLGYFSKFQNENTNSSRYIRSEIRKTKKQEQSTLQIVENKTVDNIFETVEADQCQDSFCQTDEFYMKEYCNEVLTRKNEALVKKVKRLENIISANQQMQRINFCYDSLKNNNKLTKYLTGFSHFYTLNTIFSMAEEWLPITRSGKMNKFDVFLMTLMKIRLDLPFSYLGLKYQVTTKTISKIFHESVVVLHAKIEPFVIWQDQKAVRKNRPSEFEIFGDRVPVIIDCFEVFSEKPGNHLARANTFSNYKHHNTLKYLIGIACTGAIIYISKGYGGRCSDKFIVENCGFLDMLQEGDVVLADRGFLIQSVLNEKRVRLIMPSFKNGKSQLQPIVVEQNRKIASLRIHVERLIGVLRQKFLIFTNRQPITAISKKCGENMYSDYILGIACGIINLGPQIVINKTRRRISLD